MNSSSLKFQFWPCQAREVFERFDFALIEVQRSFFEW